MKKINFLINKEFLFFNTVAVVALLVNIIFRIILDVIFEYILSIVFAQIIAMIVFYLLLKYFVFKKKKKSNPLNFTFINVISLVQVTVVSYIFVNYITVNMFTTSHLLGIGSTSITSFILHKKFSF